MEYALAIVSLQNRLNLNPADWKNVAMAAIVSLQNRLNLNQRNQER